MSKRLLGVALFAAAVLPLTAAPALAVDATEPVEEEAAAEVPDTTEICARNEVVAEYCPEPYEAPTVFTGILYPLLGIGALVTIALFLLYMRWLPNFARERQLARGRGRR
jgi:hypothetical protein